MSSWCGPRARPPSPRPGPPSPPAPSPPSPSPSADARCRPGSPRPAAGSGDLDDPPGEEHGAFVESGDDHRVPPGAIHRVAHLQDVAESDVAEVLHLARVVGTPDFDRRLRIRPATREHHLAEEV